MELIEKLILWILIFGSSGVFGGRVSLNGPQLETADLRAIDGYVASGLPLFPSTHGFVLHSGMRPVIVKVKDPNKVIRDGIEQPNPSYYRDLPSVIPQGFEGIASTSFLLGHPIPPSNLFTSPPSPGPVVQHLMYQQQQQLQQSQQQHQQARSNFGQPQQQQQQARSNFGQPQQQQQQQSPHQQFAEPSIRVENTLSPRAQFQNNQIPAQTESQDRLTTNPVVVQTSEFESNLPENYRNPFYSNVSVANQLAQHSLPAPGEQVVQTWNTNKIREGRVRDLLSGAGLI